MPVCLVLTPSWFCGGAKGRRTSPDTWILSPCSRQSPGECEHAEQVHYLVIEQKCALCNLKLNQATAFKSCDLAVGHMIIYKQYVRVIYLHVCAVQ